MCYVTLRKKREREKVIEKGVQNIMSERERERERERE